MSKRGPNTETGREVVRYNALKHGLTGAAPVITGLEQQEDWEQHVAAFHESLQPVGKLEEFLAERIVSSAWYLQRCSAYETATIDMSRVLARQDAEALLLSGAQPAAGATSMTLDQALQRARALWTLLTALTSEDGDVQVSESDVVILGGRNEGATSEVASQVSD